MSNYEQPDFPQPLPGVPGYSRNTAMSAPGSGGAGEVPELPGQTVTIGTAYGPLRQESVDRWDTAPPASQDLYTNGERISGVSGIDSTGAGQGAVRGPGHPNSMVPGASSSGPEAG